MSRYIVPWSLTVLAFFSVYWLMPARSIPWRVALMGGLVAGTLWTTLKVGFAYYVSHMANYTRTYGALATVVVFLLWINLSACLLLWGAELAASTSDRALRSMTAGSVRKAWISRPRRAFCDSIAWTSRSSSTKFLFASMRPRRPRSPKKALTIDAATIRKAASPKAFFLTFDS